MSELELYTSALIEQNKLEAPSLTIEEYNYLINKAIIQYINLTYARFDLNQQSSDDLRWLQRSVELDIRRQEKLIPPMEEANYACVLPKDYFHVLNCTVRFAPKCSASEKSSKCNPTDDDGLNGVFSLCRRLTANQFPALIHNAYLKPSYKNPYFYINESGESGRVSAAIEELNLMDPCQDCSSLDETFQEIMDPCSDVNSTTTTGKIMEIRCGKNRAFYPDVAYLDYLKLPKVINLTWKDVQSVEDNTEVCEFPNAVAYEIINIFSKLLFENASDPRLQTHFAINQTVGGIPQTESKK